jgi:hypothetical protein
MTHSLESLLSANPNPFAEAIALGTIRTVAEWLPRAVDERFDGVVRPPRCDLAGEQDPHRGRPPRVMEDERRHADDGPTEREPAQRVEEPFREEREEGRPCIRDDASPPTIDGGWAGVDRHGDAEGDGDEEERRADRDGPTGMNEDVVPVDHRD